VGEAPNAKKTESKLVDFSARWSRKYDLPAFEPGGHGTHKIDRPIQKTNFELISYVFHLAGEKGYSVGIIDQTGMIVANRNALGVDLDGVSFSDIIPDPVDRSVVRTILEVAFRTRQPQSCTYRMKLGSFEGTRVVRLIPLACGQWVMGIAKPA